MTTGRRLQGPGTAARRRVRGSVCALLVCVLGLGPGAGAAAAHSRRHHRRHDAPAASPRVTQLARCYGRFIAWRDELSSLMEASGSYTPSPDAPTRFDHLEASFVDAARADMRLELHLRPTFAETDFPDDVRAAFQGGLAEAAALYKADDYLAQRKALLDQKDLAPIPRMAALESNADARFKPLGEPCDQLATANP